jgi:N-methylhydantoinase A
VGQDGYALRVASFEIVEIGAGGGSIAWLDDARALHVGPRSAGANPGPACYGNGGTAPTVTDANVYLGRISPAAIAGGEVGISRGLAEEALSRLAGDCGISTEELALGIVAIANAGMARAIRAVTTERGKDPRESSLIAFGGAGPLHACELAERLGMTRVIIPPHSGVFSALGMLVAAMRHDFVRSVAIDLGQEDGLVMLRTELDGLEQEAADSVKAMYGRDVALDLTLRADVRYSTQQAPLTVALDGAAIVEAADLRKAFESEHLARYGYVRGSDSVKVDAIRVRVAIASAEQPTTGQLGRSLLDGQGSGETSTRMVRFVDGIVERCPIVSRLDIARRAAAGPLVVEERDTTILVPNGWTVRCDANANLHLDRVSEEHAA